jgi:hypothetical protein
MMAKRFALAILAWSVYGPLSHAAEGIPPVTKIAFGTTVPLESDPKWTHVLLVSKPRVAAGDSDRISTPVKNFAEMLSFVIAAEVKEVGDANQQRRYALADVGYGLAVERKEQLVVVSGGELVDDSAEPDAPVELGLFDRQFVAAAEESLDAMRVLHRRTTVMLVDSPAVFYLAGTHQAATMRSLIWVESATGKVGQFMWLLTERPGEPKKLGLPYGTFVAESTWEDRKMRVDETQFNLFGIPGDLAFALTALPPGKRIGLSPDIEPIATRRSYSEAEFSQLVRGLNALFQVP